MVLCREKTYHSTIFHNFDALRFASKFLIRLDFSQPQHRRKKSRKGLRVIHANSRAIETLHYRSTSNIRIDDIAY